MLARLVSKLARNAVRHRFKVWPRRAISGIGQDGKLSMILVASRRPSVALVWC